jgi:hypothetical protein
MRRLLEPGLIAVLLFCFTCIEAQQVAKAKSKEDKVKIKGTGTKKDKSTGIENNSIQGAYSMLRQIVNDGTKDSSLKNEQFKIFTDSYMMYASPLMGDTLAEYGIGKYEIKNGKVMEYVFFTSGDGARNDTFELDVRKKGNDYSQVIIFPAEGGRRFVLTEDYRNVSKNVTSPLDGAWKQTKRMYITKDGKTMADDRFTQYKIFQSGHFIWANTELDSTTKKPVSYFGYGTFEMNGNDQATETNNNSSYVKALVGRPVTLQLKFMGKDTYQQTIITPNGDQSVEVYERLK